MSLLLKNCHLISPDQNFTGSAILIGNGKIKRVYAEGDVLPSADKVIDVKGLAPTLIVVKGAVWFY